MRRITVLGLLTALLVGVLFSFGSVPTRSQEGEPAAMAPPLRAPEGYEPADLDVSTMASVQAAGDGLKAVAVVGDVGDETAKYRDDMDRAVAVLRNRGVSVETFYYGERNFTWGQVVTALSGAHFLLYMGHGVSWEGPCLQPDLVGGFYLSGDGGFVSPEMIRTDLAGQMAEGAVVILSHACYAAGDASCGDDTPSDWPSQTEAQRHVEMYAAPFVDVGVKAYFANNYYGSAANFVDRLLAEEPMTLGEVFKSVYPYDASEFRDLSYPTTGYDLWLSGTTGGWDHAFVGIPEHVFDGHLTPQLGPLPEELGFLYFAGDGSFLPASHTVTPENVGSTDTLSWEVTAEGDWFVVTPSSGETSTVSPLETGSFAIEPSEAEAVGAASATGTVTVVVTSPDGTIDGEQMVAVSLETRSGSPSRVFLPLVTLN